MRYVGSKARVAKQIREVVRSLRRDQHVHYVEPFLGGANSFAVIAPDFEKATAYELSQDVALMWQAVQGGWIPPTNVSEDEYRHLRDAPPSALRGFVGIGGSFGGKWFAGYARGGQTAAGAPRNHMAESSRAVIKKADSIRNARIVWGSYETVPVDGSCVVYCDPPYAATLGYSAVGTFDHTRFWSTAERWAETGALVLVSEYTAPESWVCVSEFPTRQSVSHVADRKIAVDRLFTSRG